jgi:hypothetical protein
VKKDLGKHGERRSTDTIQRDLERASKKARRDIGGNGILTERLYQEREKQVKWELTFPEVEQVERLVLDDEEISESKYSVQDGVLEVTDSGIKEKLKERTEYVLRIEYVPGLLKELEFLHAEKRIVRMSSVTTNDENSRSQLQDTKEEIRDTKEEINRLACSMADPQKGDHAKNQDRNHVIL